jgi:hypothetical protein
MASSIDKRQFVCNDFFIGVFVVVLFDFYGGLMAKILLRSYVHIPAYCRTGALLRILIRCTARKDRCENNCEKCHFQNGHGIRAIVAVLFVADFLWLVLPFF